MRVSTKRILSIMFAVAFFIASLVVYFNLVQTEGAVVNELRSKLLSKTNLLESQQQVVGQVQNLIAQFQNLAKVRETVSLAVPSGEQNVKALRQISAIASASGVTLTSVDFKAVLAKPISVKAQKTTSDLIKKLGTLKINLTATGAYEALKNFMTKLETTVRVANVQNFTYAPGTGQDSSDRLTVEVEMYYQE